MTAGAIPPLVELLKPNDHVANETRQFVAGSIAIIALGPSQRKRLVNAGAIDVLVPLLAPNTTLGTRVAVCMALGNLAETGQYATLIHAAGAVPRMEKVLRGHEGDSTSMPDGAMALTSEQVCDVQSALERVRGASPLKQPNFH